jgi:hypothetical protein
MLPLRVELRTSRLLNGCSSQLSYRSGAGDAGYRSPYLSHAKRALYHLSYIPEETEPHQQLASVVFSVDILRYL